MAKTRPFAELSLSVKRRKLDRLDEQRDAARIELEDALFQAHQIGYSVSEVARLAGVRRERAHYAIQRAKARRNGG